MKPNNNEAKSKLCEHYCIFFAESEILLRLECLKLLE